MIYANLFAKTCIFFVHTPDAIIQFGNFICSVLSRELQTLAKIVNVTCFATYTCTLRIF